jgi:hypothetical protein
MAQKTCFVIQGFGEKQDFTTGRVFNLDASYDVIKEAVEDAGFTCVRADEIKHAGAIDVPMYEQILNADLVIADLSTYNVNAAYELGVRHALRPRTTIIVAETGFKYPFDFSHIAIRSYEHLGKDIGRQEARRFQRELKTAIVEIVEAERRDSPVYTYLPALQPPSIPPATPGPASAARSAAAAAQAPVEAPSPFAADGKATARADSMKSIMDRARRAMDGSDFATAQALLAELHTMTPSDDQIVQMLALATYKSGLPTPTAALLDAQALLLTLGPIRSHDTETLGLWGAVHKRLWDITRDPAHIDEAIRGYERGFHLKHDYYNGINLAFLLDVRARIMEGPEAVADAVLAGRTRKRVIELATLELAALPPADVDASWSVSSSTMINRSAAEAADLALTNERRYWILATLQEAAVGLGHESAAAEFAAQAVALQPPAWMLETTANQIARLRQLLVQPSQAAPSAPSA